jgi:Putative adhesin
MTTTNDLGAVAVSHAIGTHGLLTIRVAAAEIRLAATDGDRVVVRTPNGSPLPDRVIVEAVDGGLTIREKDLLGLTFSLGRKVVQLEIEVPAAAVVAIDIASGWLDGQGLRGEQRYRLVSAETRLRGVAGRIQLNTVSGDATLELADAADLAVKSVSGDIAIRGGRLDSLRIGTTSGDVRVDSPLVGRTGNTVETLSGDVAVVATAGMRVEARTVSGDMTSDLPHRSEGRMGRRTLIVGDGSIELGFRSVSGDLRIHDGSAQAAVAPISPRLAEVPEVPEVPEAPGMPEMPASPDDDAPDPMEAERMAILRALEQGELDVPAALDRLAALGAGSTGGSDEQEPRDG